MFTFLYYKKWPYQNLTVLEDLRIGKKKRRNWKSLEEEDVHNLYSCPKIVILINK